MNHTYYVYILGGRSRNLYTGVTNSLERRIAEHRDEAPSKFAGRYKIFRLVYFEVFGNIRAAIEREKEIKDWRREKRVRLIEEQNPTWEDLNEYLGGVRSDGKGQLRRGEQKSRSLTPSVARPTGAQHASSG